MWKCHKCGKPVFFAERKQSLGYDWHPECLRCEECGKRLNPGQHAEHKGVPYCHVPCYGALFGPQLFGHGTRVESHKSFGNKALTPRHSGHNGPPLPRDHMESKLRVYNQFFENKSHEIRSREVNGRLVLEGALRVSWGVQGLIHLKEDDDQRTVVTVRKRNSCRYANSMDVDSLKNLSHKENLNSSDNTGNDISPGVLDGDSTDISMTESISYDALSTSEDITLDAVSCSSKEVSPEHRSLTLPTKLDVKQLEWDEIDELLQVERKVNDSDKLYQTMPTPLPSQTSSDLTDSESSSTLLLPKRNSSDESGSINSSLQLYTATDATLTNNLTNVTNDDDFLTPMSTLRNGDYDEFKKRVDKEFVENANCLRTSDDNTLKYNQPIDPSRINDSLKLYGDQNIMSKSYGGEQALRICPIEMNAYQTIDASLIQDSLHLMKSNRPFVLQKSGSAVSKLLADEDDKKWMQGLNRSRSGPNCFGSTYFACDDDETLKPSTIRKSDTKNSIFIKMDCYAECENEDGNQNPINVEPITPVDDSHLYHSSENGEEAVVLRKHKTGSTAIKRRSGNKRTRAKLKRRCSINGHYYNRETSFFTPPHGSLMSVWVTSLVSTSEVVNLLLEKYKVDSAPENFALFIMRDNGEQRRLKDDEYPLLVRVMMGPHEDVSKLYLMDAHNTTEISSEVAQFLNLSISECRSILDRYNEEMEREMVKIKNKYAEMRRRIVQRMESLKVRL